MFNTPDQKTKPVKHDAPKRTKRQPKQFGVCRRVLFREGTEPASPPQTPPRAEKKMKCPGAPPRPRRRSRQSDGIRRELFPEPKKRRRLSYQYDRIGRKLFPIKPILGTPKKRKPISRYQPGAPLKKKRKHQ